MLDARHYMDYDNRDYSQWFEGKHNVISDSLFQDNNRSDDRGEPGQMGLILNGQNYYFLSKIMIIY